MLLSTCDLGVGLNSKQKQRQDRDELRSKLHLLTLRHQHSVSQYYREELATTLSNNAGDNSEEKPYNN